MIDRSLATNWELKQSDKLAKKPKLKVPSGYYTKTKKKWRIPALHYYIEKRGKPRLDTPEEIKGITLLKKLAELKRRSEDNYYGKGGLAKMQSSRRLSRKSVRKLKAQQKALVKAGRGGRKAHKKRLQKERAKEKKRIRLYKSKKSQIKALKTKRLKKRKTKRKRIINRINKLFK